MNLKEIREEINSALDYNPDLKQYSDNVARVVNRHYLQISSQYQWLFMQEREMLQLRADITGDSTSTLTGYGSHYVNLPATIGAGVKNLPPDIVGKTLVNNDDGAEYKITAFIDSRKFVVDQLFPPGTITNWTIEFVNYPMPRDCIEVLGIMDRGSSTKETLTFADGNFSDSTTTTMSAPNRGRFMFLDARKEENLYLDRSDTGDPFVSIEDIHENVRPPDLPPELKEIDTSLPEAATLLPHNNEEYTVEYCYTFVYSGMESPPSEVLSVKVPKAAVGSSSPVAISLKGFQETHDVRIYDSAVATTGYTGRLKKVYRRLIFDPEARPSNWKYGSGAWRHCATLVETECNFIDKGDELTNNTVSESKRANVSNVDPSGEVFRVDRLNESGPRQYLRFWYSPKSDYMVEVRYHKRPYRLVKDSDSPEWPVQFHHYLVYASLRDICMQHGMLNHSQLYDRRAAEMLAGMKAKYLTRTDRMHIRRGFDRAMADRERFGIPSKS